MDFKAVAIIFGILAVVLLLPFVGTIIELVKIYRQPEPEKVRRTGTYFIMKAFLLAGTAIAGGLISTIYFTRDIELELREISLLLLVVPVIFYYRVKWRQLKDANWYIYAWSDLPLLILSTWLAAFAFDIIRHHF